MSYKTTRKEDSIFSGEQAYKCGTSFDLPKRDYKVDLANAKEANPRLIVKWFRAAYTACAEWGYYAEENNWPEGLPKTERVKGYDRAYAAKNNG